MLPSTSAVQAHKSSSNKPLRGDRDAPEDVIFLTGGTGFIGRIVLRKLLLRGAHVVMVIRGRHGKGAQERLQAMWEDDALKALDVSHVQVIEGDLLDPEFFETPLMRGLERRITRVVHVAASVNMHEPLEVALSNNLLPGINLYRWAQRCDCCSHVVITSTAFVNPPSEEPIYEVPCPPIPGIEVSQLPYFDSFPPWEQIRSHHFTTYTFSKAALEHHLAYLHHQDPYRFKLTFVRPSIVSVALNDPYPGWNTSLDALNGVIGLYGCGLLSGHLNMKRPTRMNVVPVDYVADSIVDSAYHRHADSISYRHATATESQHVFTHLLGLVVVEHANLYYKSTWRQPKMRYEIDGACWSRVKFHLIDILPFACASLVGSRKQRRQMRKTLYIIRSVYATLINFYGVNVFNFYSSNPPDFDVNDYIVTVTKGCFETLARRGLVQRRSPPNERPPRSSWGARVATVFRTCFQ